MKRPLFLTGLILVLVVVAIVGIGVLTANQPRAAASLRAYAFKNTFAPTACPAAADAVPNEIPLTCGYLTVPENRSAAGSRTIELAITIVHSTNPAPQTPTVYLGGGPGGPLLDELFAFISDSTTARLMVVERDWIFIEQRGVGYSRPALGCPLAAETDPVIAQQCLTTLQAQGIDLTGYNSIETAADVDDLRKALGITQWNVAGVSYGTRWALTVARYYPQAVRSLLLDGVFPPQMTPHRWAGAIPGVIDRLLDQCAADAACNASYPNLKVRLRETVAQLNRAPALVNGQPFSGDALTDWVFGALYDRESIALTPAVIDAFARADYRFVEEKVPGLQVDRTRIPAYSGMYLSVNCNEEMAFSQRSDFVRQSESPDTLVAAVGRIFLNEYTICQAWPSGQAPAIENTAVSSTVPTLILNGEFDPATPMADGYLAAETLPNATVLDFPGAGHGLITQSTCALELMNAFFSTLDGAALATTCIAEEFSAPTFLIR